MTDPIQTTSMPPGERDAICQGTSSVSGPTTAPAPVAPSERFGSIDVIRGFALLGILAININSFALPWVAYMNPTIAGGFTGLNFAEWIFAWFIFEEKMMSIFSMLFGAGIVLMTDRALARGGSPAGFFYRRAAILLVLGLLHGYLLWEGDILYCYALCGMIVYLLRKKSPRTLLLLGVLVLLPGLLIPQASSIFFRRTREAAARVEAALKAGKAPALEDQRYSEIRKGFREAFHPTPAVLAREIKVRREGSYLEIVRERAPGTFFMETFLFAILIVWSVGGRMLIGMGLLKLGVFSAERSQRFYATMILMGYGLGWPLVAAGAYGLIRHNFDVDYLLGGGMSYNEIGSILVALGHVGAIVLIYKAGAVTWLTRRLAAVGRMALTNYLMQTILCTTLFYGYGFGLFARLDRVQLLGVVAAIWVFQLWYSPLWLARFRFGPAEWLWRSLTYGKAQAMRVAAVA